MSEYKNNISNELQEIIDEVHEKIPTGDTSSDIQLIVKLHKKIKEEQKQIVPTILSVSKEKGLIACGGQMPEEQDKREMMFNKIGNVMAEKIQDVDLFVMVVDGEMSIKEMTKDSKEKKTEALIFDAKKITGEEKRFIFPFRVDMPTTIEGAEIIKWTEMKPINDLNDGEWTKKKPINHNPLLSQLWNGYKFFLFTEDLSKINVKKETN